MPTPSSNSMRIAKNTLMLYTRMLFMMTVSLYTSRVILRVLGVDDYGIYNVVGGIVALFSFLNIAMVPCTQRYLNFELGKGDKECLQRVFITALFIHALISLLIVFFAETIGLWFLYNKLTIPATRLAAAFWVYQFSILSSVALIMSAPYNATIIAHEKMSAFAYISILEVVLKLLIVYLTQIGGVDKLIIYAFLMLCVQVCIRLVYGSYCARHFSEVKFYKIWDKSLFREMLFFSGWNLFGSLASVSCVQGVNILLNIFFSPAVNAARGISLQVQNAVKQFAVNFQTAINPQITKSYAIEDYNYMHSLIWRSSKFTFILLYILSLPIILEADYILHLWLTIVPMYTTPFLRLILIESIIDAISNPLMISVSATGSIKKYQSIVGILLLMIVPVSYVVLKLGGNPVLVFIVYLSISTLSLFVRIFIVCPRVHMSIITFFQKVIIRCFFICILALVMPLLIKLTIGSGFIQFLIVCATSCICVAFFSYYIGLTISERNFVKQKVIICIRTYLSKRSSKMSPQ